MQFNPILCTDSYKLGHKSMFPEGTEYIYSNFTPRSSRIAGVDKVVFFGLQAFLIDFCQNAFDEWFELDEDSVVAEYEETVAPFVGPTPHSSDHIRALHRLGYLPLRFCALPEGTEVPLRVPMFTVENTHPEFFWLTNYIESVLSANIWLPCTSATLAHRLRKLLDERALESGGDASFVDFQGHDFSFRGMENVHAAAASGAGHLLSFSGSDSVPSVQWINAFYGDDDNGLIAASVPASEHSVMCAGGELGELETYQHILDAYPSGIVSVVSDTWDLWKILTDTIPKLKDQILSRDGRLVIRPDSGDPADILCGTNWTRCRDEYDICGPAQKGVIELLWEEFGGTTNSNGYRELDPHIGAIYGDSISYERADEITRRLMEKGFASTNVVLGVGSYTYQFNTRDTFGFAMKATWAQVDGEGRDMFKAPVTDDGVKKSATGRLAVVGRYGAHGGYTLELIERATPEQEAESLLTPVWEDGAFLSTQTFAHVRQTLKEQT